MRFLKSTKAKAFRKTPFIFTLKDRLVRALACLQHPVSLSSWKAKPMTMLAKDYQVANSSSIPTRKPHLNRRITSLSVMWHSMGPLPVRRTYAVGQGNVSVYEIQALRL